MTSLGVNGTCILGRRGMVACCILWATWRFQQHSTATVTAAAMEGKQGRPCMSHQALMHLCCSAALFAAAFVPLPASCCCSVSSLLLQPQPNTLLACTARTGAQLGFLTSSSLRPAKHPSAVSIVSPHQQQVALASIQLHLMSAVSPLRPLPCQ